MTSGAHADASPPARLKISSKIIPFSSGGVSVTRPMKNQKNDTYPQA